MFQKLAPKKRCHAISQLADGTTISVVLIILQQELNSDTGQSCDMNGCAPSWFKFVLMRRNNYWL